jgi:hypothetical protein
MGATFVGLKKASVAYAARWASIRWRHNRSCYMLAAVKTVYLHVGNFKTGTSAIQKYCSDHRGELLAAGVDYLQSARSSADRTSHAGLPLSLYRRYDAFVPDWYDDEESYDEVAAGVASEIEASDAPAVLISSEEFYRLASCPEEVRHRAMADLKALFDGCDVKIVIFVREPLEFLISWYNQVNKSLLPVRRFTDFFFYLDSSLLLPHINADFWREAFGDDCLLVQPYRANETTHVAEFLQLLGLSGVEVTASASERVNPGRPEDTLERDRVAKIMALASRGERDSYLGNHAFASVDNFEKLKARLQWINREFNRFSDRYGLDGMRSELRVGTLLVHEERVNPPGLNATWSLRAAYYTLLRVLHASGLKRVLRKILPV